MMKEPSNTFCVLNEIDDEGNPLRIGKTED